MDSRCATRQAGSIPARDASIFSNITFLLYGPSIDSDRTDVKMMVSTCCLSGAPVVLLVAGEATFTATPSPSTVMTVGSTTPGKAEGLLNKAIIQHWTTGVAKLQLYRMLQKNPEILIFCVDSNFTDGTNPHLPGGDGAGGAGVGGLHGFTSSQDQGRRYWGGSSQWMPRLQLGKHAP